MSDPQYWKIMENLEKDIRCNTQKVREYLELENVRKSVRIINILKLKLSCRQLNKTKNKEKHLEELRQTKTIMKNLKSEKASKRFEQNSIKKK